MMVNTFTVLVILLQQVTTSPLLCYYQPATARLGCECGQDGQEIVNTTLRLDSITTDNVKILEVQHCPHLALELDLVNVDASSLRIHFSKCNQVSVLGILLETDFSGHQTLSLQFSSVQTVKLIDLFISDQVSIELHKVGSVDIVGCSFCNLTREKIKSVKSGAVCVTNSRLTDCEDQQMISACPWLSASPPSHNQIESLTPSSFYSLARDNSNLTNLRSHQDSPEHYPSLAPHFICITVFILIFLVLYILILLILPFLDFSLQHEYTGRQFVGGA